MIPNYIVTENPDRMKLNIPNVQVVSARRYLTDSYFGNLKSAKIFNLCKSYRYQSQGYYVSLLATARKHRVLPDPVTIQDLKLHNIVKIFSSEIDDLIQKKLRPIKSNHFTMNIYFGKNIAKTYDDLAKKLFSFLKSPLLRAEFSKNGKWCLTGLRPLAYSDMEEKHLEFFEEAARDFFNKKYSYDSKKNYSYDLAILHNPEEPSPPSNAKALKKFIKMGKKLGINVELITKDDFSKILEYDALFLRETTSVNHHTYRIARKAQAEGLIVIDDPESILKCTNKVFLEELLNKYNIPRPKTMILHKDNMQEVLEGIGLPCILKQPDSAFSQGVKKASTIEEFTAIVTHLLSKSDLIIVQEFLPSDFDWRIGILNNRPLYACKYYMAEGHWQIINNVSESVSYNGNFETLDVAFVPKAVLNIAQKTSRLIGEGLYGIDIKQVKGKAYLIEINDNPNIDCGVEDKVIGDELYMLIMRYFLSQLNHQRHLGVL